MTRSCVRRACGLSSVLAGLRRSASASVWERVGALFWLGPDFERKTALVRTSPDSLA